MYDQSEVTIPLIFLSKIFNSFFQVTMQDSTMFFTISEDNTDDRYRRNKVKFTCKASGALLHSCLAQQSTNLSILPEQI